MKAFGIQEQWTHLVSQSNRLKIGVLVSFLVLMPFTFAQDEDDEDIFVLSPFEVDTSEDSRWRNTDSTSGTTLNTAIKDIPMSIEVINSDFLEDIGATTFEEALEYSAGVNLELFSTPSELVNISTRGYVGSSESAMIGGFVIEGSEPLTVLIQGVGQELIGAPGLDASNTLSNPTISLVNAEGEIIKTNDNWFSEDESAKSQAMISTGSYILAENSKSSALLATLDPGLYSVVVNGVEGLDGIALAEVYRVPGDSSSRLVNVSTRAQVGVGHQVTISGFVIEGDSNMKLLVQGVGFELIGGPELTIDNVLWNTVIALQGATSEIAADDDWDFYNSDLKLQAMIDTGSFLLFPNGPSASLLETLAPGGYTVSMSGYDSSEGIALVEVYEID